MIYSLVGKIQSVHMNAVVVETEGGVGYLVHTTPETIKRIVVEGRARMYTSLRVREDALDLYGFATEEDLKFFELLNTVSGVGPKAAMAILGVADIATLRSAIASGKADVLSRAGGVGRKTSERLIVELKDKVGKSNERTKELELDLDILDALKSLGYSTSEAQHALKKIPVDVVNSSDRLKVALKVLGKK
ncbi:MAG: Holliday junction branch migration protein RuvA [Parcubacteria group bacterium]|nr:Holliday junction branch migration protein RuvA [Parcubacteria group bacterium]